MTIIYIHIDEFRTDYQKLLFKYIKKTITLAKQHVKETTQLQKRKTLGIPRPTPTLLQLPISYISMKAKEIKDTITNKKPRMYKIQENKTVTRQLKDNTRITSKYVTTSMVKRINEILSTSEIEGLGNKQVAKKLQKEFKELKGYKARRIARTEINATNNKVTHDELLKDDTVQYKQWITCEDNRVRISHKELDGEITRIGNTFSNGLQYPGDHNGQVKEFINCRCTLIAYYPDWDKIPPQKEQFHENELQALPENKQMQIEIQINENKQLFETKNKYLQAKPEITIQKQPNKILEIQENTQNILTKEEEETYQTLLTKLKQNNGTITVKGTNIQIKGLKLKEKAKLKQLYEKKHLSKQIAQEKQALKLKHEQKIKAQQKQKILDKQREQKEQKRIIKIPHNNETYIQRNIDWTDPEIEEIMNMYGITEEEFQKLPQNVKEAVKNYTSLISKVMNAYERGGMEEVYKICSKDKHLPEKIPLIKPTIQGLKEYEQKLKENTILWRGEDKKYYDFTIGKINTWDFHASTSLNKDESLDGFTDGDNPVLYKIFAPKNTPANVILSNSQVPNEQEILLTPRQKWKVLDVNKEKNITLVTIELI